MQYSVYVRFGLNGSEGDISAFAQDLANKDILYFRDRNDFFVGADQISKITVLLNSNDNITYKVY